MSNIAINGLRSPSQKMLEDYGFSYEDMRKYSESMKGASYELQRASRMWVAHVVDGLTFETIARLENINFDELTKILYIYKSYILERKERDERIERIMGFKRKREERKKRTKEAKELRETLEKSINNWRRERDTVEQSMIERELAEEEVSLKAYHRKVHENISSNLWTICRQIALINQIKALRLDDEA